MRRVFLMVLLVGLAIVRCGRRPSKAARAARIRRDVRRSER